MIRTGEYKIEMVPIKDLKPASYNPRKWSENELQNLCDSITTFGIVDPVIANSAPKRKNTVIGGHMRIKAAEKAGYKEVPVVYVNIPDIKKEKELNLRLNRNTGQWDWELLKQFDTKDLLEMGFDDEDLGAAWDDVLTTEDDSFNVEKAIAEIKVPETKYGDIYRLGEHRLMCGDSTKIDDIQKLMGDEKVGCIISDPPYNIGMDYASGIGTKGKYKGKMRKDGNQKSPDLEYKGFKVNDRKKQGEYSDFLNQTITNALMVAKPDVHIFYWCDENYVWMVQKLFQDAGLVLRRICMWVKNNQNVTPQVAFNKVIETCIYGTRGNPFLNKKMANLNEVINKEVDTGNQLIDDILDIINIWLVKRDPAQEYMHPTQKPVTLLEKPVKRCTKIGDLVLDSFGGSGTTMIACEQLKRRSFLCELDPVFCDVIIRRWEELTGKKAELLK